MRIEGLRYSLVPENLEGTPREIRLGQRDLGRMLVVDRKSNKIGHATVRDLPSVLKPGDVLVLNNSKRLPGVLHGRTEVGGQVEFRFVDLVDEESGLCRIFPMHDVRPGTKISLRGGGSIEVLKMGLTKYGLAMVRTCDASLRSVLRSQGTPILGFFYCGAWTPEHLNPYYATEEGSVESPLAGLHFTSELVAAFEEAGVEVHFVTLHSVGSWLPFLEENVEEHEMWAETFSISEKTASAIAQARKRGSNVVACGSTSLRALESAATTGRCVKAMTGRTRLYITPGYEFQVVDNYFTNFHQYQTSLIVLDVAFGGEKLVKKAYRNASKLKYSFFEFGDAVVYL